MDSDKDFSAKINELSYSAIGKMLLQLLFAMFFIIYISKQFILDFQIVSSDSMSPELQTGDYIIVSKLAYSCFGIPISDIQIGDIVALEYEEKKLVKRVAGLAGDTLYYDDENCFNLRSDSPVSLAYMQKSIVPKDALFLIGDNIRNSRDSRDFGTVASSLIIGKPILIYYSKNNKGITFLK